MAGEAVPGLIVVVAGARHSDVQCVAHGDIVEEDLKDMESCPLPIPWESKSVALLSWCGGSSMPGDPPRWCAQRKVTLGVCRIKRAAYLMPLCCSLVDLLLTQVRRVWFRVGWWSWDLSKVEGLFGEHSRREKR